MRDATVNKTEKSALSQTGFGYLHCDSVSFEFRVTLDKFDLEDFKKPFSPRFKEPLAPGLSFFAMFSTLDPKVSDYHVHLDWHLSKNRADVTLSYYKGPIPADKDEKEPYAETAMQWLGKFFKTDKATAHVHAAFEYPAEKWRFMIPLPIKIPVASEAEVEIDGVSMNLPKHPLGINQAWIVSREKESRVLFYGDRPVNFDKFDIGREIEGLAKFAVGFVREASNETDKQ